MLFRLKANCIFEAEDIDDAIEKLGDHFYNMFDSEGGLTDDHLFVGGEIEIKPEK